MRSTNLFILSRIRKNCHINGRALLLCLYMSKGNKLTETYRGISLLPIKCNIMAIILLSRLTPSVEEIIEDYQCGFRHNRPNANQIFCIHQILKKKWECNRRVRQLFIDFKKACDSGERYCATFALNLVYL